MSARPLLRDRYSFGNLEKVLELPDLIAVQHESFNWLMESGLKGIFSDISPITDVSETLSLELEFDPKDIDLRPPPKFTVDECKEKDMTYSGPIFVRARFFECSYWRNKRTNRFLRRFPSYDGKRYLHN